MRASSSAALLAAAVVTLTACPDDPVPACTPPYERGSVLAIARDWYLYPDLLDAQAPSVEGETTQAYLSALTKPAQDAGKDRGWSYVSTRTALQQRYEEGVAVGFGFRGLLRDQQYFVAEVFAGSAAAAAGLERGAELLAVGETFDALVEVSTLLVQDPLGGGVADALGPGDAGITRTFRFRTRAGNERTETITKGSYLLDPVPTPGGYAVVARDGLPPAGYVNLRTFISPAEPRLQEAFLAFKSAGVTDVAVDVRYNGGGLVRTAELLANLLGGGLAGQRMYTVGHNDRHASDDAVFGAEPNAIAPARIAFITKHNFSASASELVPNVLEPYASVAIVGERTYGKPVGQYTFAIDGCETVLGLISFRLLNAQGEGEYFDGLPAPGFTGPLCPAEDDLTHELGAKEEASMAAALGWLATGTCPGASALLSAPPPDVYPMPRGATFLDAELPGLF